MMIASTSTSTTGSVDLYWQQGNICSMYTNFHDGEEVSQDDAETFGPARSTSNANKAEAEAQVASPSIVLF